MSIALILAAFQSLVAIGMDGAKLLEMVRNALNGPDANPTAEDWAALHAMEDQWQVIIDKRMQTVGT